jgi:hypothetical protein
MPLTGPQVPKDIEFHYAWYRALRDIAMVNGGGAQWPRANIPIFAGTITDLDSTTLTDSDADFSTPLRCGLSVELTGCTVQIFFKDDPRYVAKSTITGSTGTTLALDKTDWVARGICSDISDLIGSQYCVYAGGDISSYDRWLEPPNSWEYVANKTLAAAGLPGSYAVFPTAVLTITGTATAGTYTLSVTGGTSVTTASIAFNASTAAIQSAIEACSNVGSGKVIVTPYQGNQTIAFDPSLGTTSVSIGTDSLTGATIAASAMATTLLDLVQTWTANQWTTAQPDFPDNPTGFDLVIWDNGTNGDGLAHRLSITSNDNVSISTGSLGSWVPSLNCYYSIVATGGIWHPQKLSGPRKVWYRGAMDGDHAVTHMPDDSIGSYPPAAASVSFDGGEEPPTCSGPTGHSAMDVDVWNDCCDADCCSRGNNSFSPDFYKSVRGIQDAMIELFGGLPWVDPTFYIDGLPSSARPRPLTFPVAAAASATLFGSDINNFATSIGSISSDNSKAYIGITPPYTEPVLYFTLFDSTGAVVLNSSAIVETDETGAYISGSWSSGNVGQTMSCTYGFGDPFDYGVMYLWPKTIWLPSMDSDGNLVDPPRVDTDPITHDPIFLLGSWVNRPVSTNYVRYDTGIGTPSQAGPAFTTGDLAEYLGDNACDPTLADVGATSPYVQYQDHKFTGKLGKTPPNAFYANSDSNGGTGGKVMSYANSSGLTTQISVDPSIVNWFPTWYSSGADVTGTVMSGTATAGSSTALVDTSATMTTAWYGLTINITHLSVTTPFRVTGVDPSTHTLTLAAVSGVTVNAGDTYTITIPGASIYRDFGTATGGSATTLVDTSKIAVGGFFSAGLYDTGYTLKVFHTDPTTHAQTMTKYFITAADPTTGTLTVDGVDGAPTIANGDLYQIDWPYELNRWQTYQVTVNIPAVDGNPASTVTVIARGNDQSTMFIVPQSGFTLTDDMIAAGVTFSTITFKTGDVLKYDGSHWTAPTGTDNRPDPNNSSIKPTFRARLADNLPFRFDWYGRIHRGTYWCPQWWNQMYYVLKTFYKQAVTPVWDNKGENNAWDGSGVNFALYYYSGAQVDDQSPTGGWATNFGYTELLSSVGRENLPPGAGMYMEGWNAGEGPGVLYALGTGGDQNYSYIKVTAPTYCRDVPLTVDCYDYGVNPCEEGTGTSPIYVHCRFDPNGLPVTADKWTFCLSVDVTTNNPTPYYSPQVGTNTEPDLPPTTDWPTSTEMDTSPLGAFAGYAMGSEIIGLVDWSSVLTFI